MSKNMDSEFDELGDQVIPEIKSNPSFEEVSMGSVEENKRTL